MPIEIIAVIIVATAVPTFLWGYKRGYARATADHYGPAVLQQSAAELGAQSPSDGESG